MYRISSFVRWFAWALLSGAALATIWVNIDPASYYDAIEWRIVDLTLPAAIAPYPISLSPLVLISEGFMALFVFFIGKELWEALAVEHGALHGTRAILPATMVAGAVTGGVILWVLTGAMIEAADEATFAAGWTVPVGSDVVLAYVIGRRVFGAGHPALHLLLLITIACDILGLLMTGIAYPPGGLRPLWLVLPLVAGLGVWWCYGRHTGRRATERERRQGLALWPYVLAGGVSWGGVLIAGLPGALGLLPIIPAIPHAARSFGLFAEAEELLHDPLNRLEHLLVRPLAAVLFLFGLTRGGIDLGAVAPTTMTVLAAFWIGKPLGLLAGYAVATRITGETLPRGITTRDLRLVALLCGIGFTVPVLSLNPGLPGGAMAEAARLGLALTLLVAVLAPILRR